MNPRWLVWLFSVCAPGAFAVAGGLSDWQAEKVPRLRIAASPYPNFLLEVLPTGADFGTHLYRVKIDSLGMGPSSELARGHFYTRRGGFLDLAHIRRAIDLAGYVHYHVRDALTRGETGFSFENIDRTTYRVTLHYPDFWSALEPVAKARLIEEVAVRAGETAALDLSNWREILTWYGFHNVPGMPEKSSAFSFEDLPSHAVGAAVAGRALRRGGVPFDEAVTLELDRELAELGVVPLEVYDRAMALVEGKWWAEKATLKRHLDTGHDDGVITPWLVRGLFPGESPAAKSYRMPRGPDDFIHGHDCRGLVVFSCEPRPRRREVRESVTAMVGSVVVPPRDYPAILTRIETEMKAELGVRATVPYP